MNYPNPSSQLNVIYEHLVKLGYDEPQGKIVRGYEFVTKNGKKSPWDLIAFGNANRYDISTACIAVNDWPNGRNKSIALRELSSLGTPLAVLTLPNDIEIWSVVSDETQSPQLLETLRYNELPDYFSRYGYYFSPDSLLKAKKKATQFSFFKIDPQLQEFAREATRKTLVKQFQDALGRVSDDIRQKKLKPLVEVAIAILTARILQDKLIDIADLQTRDVNILLNVVQEKFPDYFDNLDADLAIIGQDTAKMLYNDLLGEFTFRSITNDMLSYFYENALVDDKLRQELGIYYTPDYIAERIFQRLPIEDLPPEKRIILDGTCGSGNMLLAGYNRLASLLPIRWSSAQRHQYLRQSISGIDKDNIACQVARRSLLLQDLSEGGHWNIIHGDVFETNPEKRPFIIVSNPPFDEPRSTEGKRVQKAAKILEIYLEWLEPYGYLGIVMPLAFLHNASCQQERANLLKSCDILEVWHLPEKAIPSSSVAIAVIIAQKLPTKSGQFLTRIDKFLSNEINQIKVTEPAAITYLKSQEEWSYNRRYEMVSSIFDNIWIKIKNQFDSLGLYCNILSGIDPGVEGRKNLLSYDKEGDEWKPILNKNNGGKILAPYFIDWASQKERFIKYNPNEFERARVAEHFDKTIKIIMNRTRNANSDWRFYAALDENKLLVSRNFHYILPLKETLVNEILTVLNSMIANIWFASHSLTYSVNITILKRLPFPQFNDQQKQQISVLVQDIIQLKKSPSDKNYQQVREYIVELDEIVFDAYGLNEIERQQIKDWMNQFQRPGQEWEGINRVSRQVKPPKIEREWIITGQVESIDMEQHKVSLFIDGEVFEINIPPTMPGWALRPNAAFDAAIPWEQRHESDFTQVTWLHFQPLGYGYLSDEELLLTQKITQ